MGTVDGRVDEDGLQIGQMDAALVERLPYAEPAPARKPLEHGVPLAVGAGQQPPLRPATQYPQHGAEESPTPFRVANPDIRVVVEDWMEDFPFPIHDGQSICHFKSPVYQRPFVVMSTEPKQTQ